MVKVQASTTYNSKRNCFGDIAGPRSRRSSIFRIPPIKTPPALPVLTTLIMGNRTRSDRYQRELLDRGWFKQASCGPFTLQSLANLTHHALSRKRLLQEKGILQKLGTASILFEVPGHINDLHARQQSFKLFGERRPSHLGHHHIRQHHLNRCAQSFRSLQRFRAVLRRKNIVTGRPQKLGSQLAHFAFVFHNEHSFRTSITPIGFPRCLRRLHQFVGSWQINLKSCSAARMGLYPDETSALFHDAVHGRQAKPGSPAGFLGREEWLENARLGGRVHSVPRVADAYYHVRARLHRWARSRVFLVDNRVLRLDGQRAPYRHGVAGVHGQVQQHLLELSGIRFYAPERVTQSKTKLNVFPNQPSQELAHLSDQLIHVQNFGLEHLHPAESKHLAGQRSGPVGGFQNLLGVAVEKVPGSQAVEEQFTVPSYHRQQVVKVVSHAACQSSQRLHLLRLAELAFELLALSFVPLQCTAHANKCPRQLRQ